MWHIEKWHSFSGGAIPRILSHQTHFISRITHFLILAGSAFYQIWLEWSCLVILVRRTSCQYQKMSFHKIKRNGMTSFRDFMFFLLRIWWNLSALSYSPSISCLISPCQSTLPIHVSWFIHTFLAFSHYVCQSTKAE